MSVPFDFSAPFICYSFNCPLGRQPPPGSIPPQQSTIVPPGPIRPNTLVLITSSGVSGCPPFTPNMPPPRFPIPQYPGYQQFSQPLPIILPKQETPPTEPLSVLPPEPPNATEAESESIATVPDVDPMMMYSAKTSALPTPTDIPVNFSTCTARFNGIGDVRPFINAIVDFKTWVDMSDETALRSFPLLLMDLAAIWWQANKDTVTTWNDAIDLLRTTYRARPQPYKVYRHLFSSHQKDETTAVFVKKAKALLNQLPPYTLTEVTQVDLVYGLLHRRIREKVNRSDCIGFSELLKLAKQVEDSADDATSKDGTEKATSESTPAKALTSAGGTDFLNACEQCQSFGHLLIGMCRKLHKKTVEELIVMETLCEVAESHRGYKHIANLPPPKTYCYRCGSLNIVRLKCFDCIVITGSGMPVKPKGRPLITVNICGLDFDIVVDTGARNCIATSSLTAHLAENKQDFTYDDLELPMGDGVLRQIMRVTTADVWVAGIAVRTSFVDLPNAKTNILGMDFVMNAGLVLDFRGNGTWYLRDIAEEIPLMYETLTRDEEETELKNP